MIVAGQADDTTLMRIYKEALTHTLDAAVRAVYEQGLRDGIDAASTPQAPVAAAGTTGPAQVPSPKPTSTK